jgi:hypothetical protein
VSKLCRGRFIRVNLDLRRWLFKLTRHFRSWTAINFRDRTSRPTFKKYFLLALALSGEACRIFAFIVLAKAALEAATCPPPEGGGNLNSRRTGFDTRSSGR